MKYKRRVVIEFEVCEGSTFKDCCFLIQELLNESCANDETDTFSNTRIRPRLLANLQNNIRNGLSRKNKILRDADRVHLECFRLEELLRNANDTIKMLNSNITFAKEVGE